ncbi:MAG: type II toxin-antitoxin system RatA family toxin [Alphaproteobacteria bacterium]|nr:type II toxin-antitoxin system RatA family toxin [Alphaproteobacteria bacterium]
MPVYSEKRRLSYTSEQLFNLVIAVDKYPEFLPWCVESRITKQEENVFYADLVIGYKMIRERFSSKVTLKNSEHVHVEYLKGPMKYLSNHWRFISEPDGSCIVDFYVEFEFKNRFFQRLMGVFFSEIVRRMVTAFEIRAKELYD